MKQTSQQTRTLLQTLLDGVEQVGNKVPHPAVIFLVLMGVVVLLSQAFSVLGTSVSYQRINPQTHDLEDVTATVKSLLSADGIRFLFTSAVRNFLNFGPVGVILVAMVGVGLAEQAGLIGFNMTPRSRSADVTSGVSTSVPRGLVASMTRPISTQPSCVMQPRHMLVRSASIPFHHGAGRCGECTARRCDQLRHMSAG